MSNKSNLIFGNSTNLTLAATPSTGYLVAYDSRTGVLSQKNSLGIISKIGVSATSSGVLETFPSDIQVSLSPGKSFGKYVNGDIIPSYNKTAVELIIDSLSEPIQPTILLNSSTTITFNQTDISNILDYNYVINSLGATATVLLEWRRNNTGSWTTLSTDESLTTFTHIFTDTEFNSYPFNYKYIVTDSQGATNFETKDIAPESYSSPTTSLSVTGITLSLIESDYKREKGNIASNISGSITRNSSLVNLSYYQLQYQKNDSGPWQNIGATVSISGSTAAISTYHNDTLNLSDATSILYRVQVTDRYTTITSNTSTVNLYNVIFYGPTSSTPVSSNDVRNLPNKIFTDDTNPFILNTGNIESNFSVALPTTISQVLDLDTLSANITSLYTLNTFFVNDFYGTPVSYKVYTMTNGIGYSSNHRHQITRT